MKQIILAPTIHILKLISSKLAYFQLGELLYQQESLPAQYCRMPLSEVAG